jgi:hypothetical protein
MATVTNAYNAKNCNFQIQRHDLTMFDFSGFLTGGDLEGENNVGDFAVYEDDWMYNLVGKKSISGTLQIIASTGAGSLLRWANEWFFNDHQAARRIILSMPNKNVGSERLDGHYLLKTIPWSTDPGEPGPMKIALAIVGTGEVVYSIVGS